MSAEMRQGNHVRAVERDLRRVRVEAAKFRSCDDRVRVVEHLRAIADLSHEAIAIAAHTILRRRGSGNGRVARLRVREQVAAVGKNDVGVAAARFQPCVLREARVLENVERVAELHTQRVHQLAIVLVREGLEVRGVQRIENLYPIDVGVVHRAVNAQQIVAAQRAEIRHGLLAAQAGRHVRLN